MRISLNEGSISVSSKRATKAEKGPATWDTPEYIAECEANARKIAVQYEGGDKRIARLVHSYRRTDPDIKRGPIMSASSGPKDYLCNDVIALFDRDERIEQVAFFVLAMTPFLLYRIGSWWFDLSKPEPRRVLVSEG